MSPVLICDKVMNFIEICGKVTIFINICIKVKIFRWCGQWDGGSWRGLVDSLLAFENGGGLYRFPHPMGLFDGLRSVP